MFLPELNHISNYRYDLGGFGGINRRETAGIGEFVKAVNLSADEYPLITPRKRYNVGEFEKFAAMWHNNDRDMELVPALKTEDVYKAVHVRKVDQYVGNAKNGRFGLVYLGDTEAEFYYMNQSGNGKTVVLKPGKGYDITKTGTDESTDKMIGTITEVTKESYIRMGADTENIYIPEFVAFKNPVTANIGTSTVICDEINGMWVLEYDKDTDTYTYNKVQNKYEVSNEVNNHKIVGGAFCHLRIRFDDYTLVKNYVGAKTEEELLALTKDTESKANWLIAYGENPMIECQWYRLTTSKQLMPVDDLIYEFCTIEGAQKFFTGDYVELKMSPKFEGNPNWKEELNRLNGMYEVSRIGENVDGVKYSVMLKGAAADFVTIVPIIVGHATSVRDGDNVLTNNLYLDNGMTIERKSPENVRFICSHMNRIWANNGDNEIMCCARGNPYVWYRYEGNALDSWATTIGGDGTFTGCINYGYPLFFKDNRMYRITGTRPANFGFDEYSMKGIKHGCHDSAVIVNDVLYYQSKDGIYAYAQATPVCVSDKIYKDGWQRGKACRYKDKYYIAVAEGKDNKLYCYDTQSGIWHEESYNGLPVKYIYPGSYLEGYEEYMTVYVDRDENSYTGFIMSTGETLSHDKEQPVKWEFETTDLLASEIEHKYLKKLYINCRIYPEEYNEINIEVQYDGDGEWHHIKEITPTKGESRSVWYCYPMSNKRLENFKIRVTGIGEAVIYGIVLEFEKGA